MTYNDYSQNSPCRAFTLTEMAIVLGVVGLVLGAIWAASADASQGRKVNQAQNDLIIVVGNVRALYASHGTIPPPPAGTPDYTAAFQKANVFPPDMLATGVPTDPWNDLITVSSQQGWGGAPVSASAFEIQYTGMTNTACFPFLDAIVNSAATTNGLLYVYADNIGGTAAVSGLTDATLSSCVSAASTTATGNVVLQYSIN